MAWTLHILVSVVVVMGVQIGFYYDRLSAPAVYPSPQVLVAQSLLLVCLHRPAGAY
ncbi:MAG: hypothetical protein ACRDCT_02555 [Shewanella sp.]